MFPERKIDNMWRRKEENDEGMRVEREREREKARVLPKIEVLFF